LINEEPKVAGRWAFFLGVVTRTSYFIASTAIALSLSLYWWLVPCHPLENLTDQKLTNMGDFSSLEKKKTLISNFHLRIRTLTNVHFNSHLYQQPLKD